MSGACARGRCPRTRSLGLRHGRRTGSRTGAGGCGTCARSGGAPVARARSDSRHRVQPPAIRRRARHPQCLISREWKARPGHGSVRDRGVHGFGLQFGHARAELRVACAGPEHGAGAKLAAAVPGRFTTAADVDAAATAIRAEVGRLRVLAGEAAVSGAGSQSGASPAPGSLMTRTCNESTRRYFLAPARRLSSREVRRPPGSAPGQPDAGLREPGSTSSCISADAIGRQDCEKCPFQCVRMPPYSGRGRLVM